MKSIFESFLRQGDSKTIPFEWLAQPSMFVSLAFEAEENTTFVVTVGDLLQITGECSHRERQQSWTLFLENRQKQAHS